MCCSRATKVRGEPPAELEDEDDEAGNEGDECAEQCCSTCDGGEAGTLLWLLLERVMARAIAIESAPMHPVPSVPHISPRSRSPTPQHGALASPVLRPPPACGIADQ